MQSINDTKDYLDLVFDDIEHFKTYTLPLLIPINVGLVMRWLVEEVVLFFVHISIFIKENIQKFKTVQSFLVFLLVFTQGMQLLILKIMISDFFPSTFYLKIKFF